MANVLGPSLRQLLWSRKVPLFWCLVVPILLSIGGLWLIYRALLDNSVSVLGEIEIPDRGTFLLGQNDEVEFGKNLWVQVDDSEWQSIGWSLNGGSDSLTAKSADGRFYGIVAEGIFDNYTYSLQDAPIVVILDSKTGVVWPTDRAQNNLSDFWMDAWKKIKQTEPRFPVPPA